MGPKGLRTTRMAHGIFYGGLRNTEIDGFESWSIFRFNLIEQ
jgi:hypothetical protein